jgi:hypothetical protein
VWLFPDFCLLDLVEHSTEHPLDASHWLAAQDYFIVSKEPKTSRTAELFPAAVPLALV